jgi:hypothetical protein
MLSGLRVRRSLLLVSALVAACSSPSAPSRPLSSDIQWAINPPGPFSTILSGPPWHWQTSIQVNFFSSGPVTRDPGISASVKVRVEDANGRVVAQVSEAPRRLEIQGGYLREQFSETLVYEKADNPPGASRVVVEGHLSDRDGGAQDVSLPFLVSEEVCGSKATPSCGGLDILVSRGGVDPSSLTIRFGQIVSFVSSDGRPHKIASDRNPDCPALNVPEFAFYQNSGYFLTPATTCHYHDENFPSVRGQVVVLPIGVAN